MQHLESSPSPLARALGTFFGAELAAGVAALFLLAVALAAAGVLAFLPTLFVSAYPSDSFIPLDAAWRWHWGQIPHRDYYTPAGALWVLLHGLAFELTGDARSIAYANLLSLVVVLPALLVVVPRRLPTAPAILAGALLAIGALSPHSLDGPSTDVAWLASYNRLSWVLFGVIAVAAALEPKETPRRGLAMLETILLAVALSALAWLKISVALAGAAILLAGAVLGDPRMRPARLAALAGGTGLALLAGLATGLLVPYAEDLARAAAAAPALRWKKLLDGIAADLLAYGAFALTLLLAWGALRRGKEAAGRNICAAFAGHGRTLLLVFAFVGANIAIASQNHDKTSLVLPLAGLLLWERLRRDGALAAPDWRALLAFPAVISILLLIIPETRSILEARRMALSAPPVAERGPLARLVFSERMHEPSFLDGATRADIERRLAEDPKGENIGFAEFGLLLREGKSALERFAPGRGPIFTAATTSYFGAWTETKPQKGGALWLDLDRTFNATSLDPEAVLVDAEVVAIPRYTVKQSTTDAIVSAIAPTLAKSFVIAGETPLWTIYVRRR